VKFGPDGLNVNNKEVLAEWIKGISNRLAEGLQTVPPLVHHAPAKIALGRRPAALVGAGLALSA
jgi:hypothetical protein